MEYRHGNIRDVARCPNSNTIFAKKCLAAAEESIIWVAAEEDRIAGFCIMTKMSTENASPDGWWLAYAYTHPGVRGTHVGVPVIRAALTELDAMGISPRLFRKPDDSRTLIGAWNYVAGGDFFFLGCSPQNGYQMYEANPLDLSWGLE